MHNVKIRVDIQALRGIAVLFVVLYHSKVINIDAGYLGVDVFFVISGFLITKIIKTHIDEGRFSFKEFYIRRAKRLLPAAYVTLFFTAVFSIFFLNRSELNDLVYQLIGAITFSANMVLWQQAGYFGGEAELKPLLHVWSLSLEEQYYFFLPVFLILIPRCYWKQGTLVLLLVSMTLCLMLITIKPIATFYILPTRAWELTLGSLIALGFFNLKYTEDIKVLLFWPAIGVLFLLPFFPTGFVHPSADALLMCMATLIVILRMHPDIQKLSITRFFAWVGGFSYSLYLAHWPVLAFFNNAYVESPSMMIKIIALSISFLGGYLLYRFVEQPFREKNYLLSPKLVFNILVVSGLIVIVPILPNINTMEEIDYEYMRRPNQGLNEACDYKNSFTSRRECISGPDPSMLVWGDSFAMHLIPGIRASTQENLIQATSTLCGPFVDVAPFDSKGYPKSWAQGCIKFNSDVFHYLADNDSIRHVILASQFFVYVQDVNWKRKFSLLLKNDDGFMVEASSVDNAYKYLFNTIKKLKGLGKNVTVIAPPPSSGFNIGGCLERKANNKLVIGGNSDCTFSVESYQDYQSNIIALLRRLEEDVRVIYLEDAMCNKVTCFTETNDAFYYVDDGHLTVLGSEIIGRKLKLGESITMYDSD